MGIVLPSSRRKALTVPSWQTTTPSLGNEKCAEMLSSSKDVPSFIANSKPSVLMKIKIQKASQLQAQNLSRT